MGSASHAESEYVYSSFKVLQKSLFKGPAFVDLNAPVRVHGIIWTRLSSFLVLGILICVKFCHTFKI